MKALLPERETPPYLYEAILERIALAGRRTARLRLAMLATLIVTCGSVLVPTIDYLLSELYASGFYEYFSLFFSDTSTAFSHWQEILVSLGESLPSLALIPLVVLVPLFLWLLVRAASLLRPAFTPLQSI